MNLFKSPISRKYAMARIKPQTLLLQSKKKKVPTRISLTTIIFCNMIVVVVVLSLVTTYRHLSQRSRNLPDGLSDLEDADGFAKAGKADIPSYAILDTTKGSITVELFKEAPPEVMDKFIDLCQKGRLKGMVFHRVIKNYVMRAGGMQRPYAEDWMLKGKPQNQLVISPKHEAFMLGTSKAIDDNKGYELFITTAPIPDLSDKLVIFGQVINGENVVKEIDEVETDKYYHPMYPVLIIKVTLKQES